MLPCPIDKSTSLSKPQTNSPLSVFPTWSNDQPHEVWDGSNLTFYNTPFHGPNLKPAIIAWASHHNYPYTINKNNNSHQIEILSMSLMIYDSGVVMLNGTHTTPHYNTCTQIIRTLIQQTPTQLLRNITMSKSNSPLKKHTIPKKGVKSPTKTKKTTTKPTTITDSDSDPDLTENKTQPDTDTPTTDSTEEEPTQELSPQFKHLNTETEEDSPISNEGNTSNSLDIFTLQHTFMNDMMIHLNTKKTLAPLAFDISTNATKLYYRALIAVKNNNKITVQQITHLLKDHITKNIQPFKSIKISQYLIKNTNKWATLALTTLLIPSPNLITPESSHTIETSIQQHHNSSTSQHISNQQHINSGLQLQLRALNRKLKELEKQSKSQQTTIEEGAEAKNNFSTYNHELNVLRQDMTCFESTMHSYGEQISKLNQNYCRLATEKETAKKQRETMNSQISKIKNKQLHTTTNQPADTDAISALVAAQVDAILEEKDLTRLKDAITLNKPKQSNNKKDSKQKSEYTSAHKKKRKKRPNNSSEEEEDSSEPEEENDTGYTSDASSYYSSRGGGGISHSRPRTTLIDSNEIDDKLVSKVEKKVIALMALKVGTKSSCHVTPTKFIELMRLTTQHLQSNNYNIRVGSDQLMKLKPSMSPQQCSNVAMALRDLVPTKEKPTRNKY